MMRPPILTVRRLIDVSVSSLVLLGFSPLMAIIWLAVRCSSPGPGLYAATRVGERGQLYRMWKFRSMTHRRSDVGPAVSLGDDSRVTRVGRILRSTKLDELPQFWNVLVGEMSLVGPRPESPELARHWTDEQSAITQYRPGVTGRAQLDYSGVEDNLVLPAGVSAETYYVRDLMGQKITRDLEYMGSRTLASDLSIVIETACRALSVAGATLFRVGDGEARQ